MPASGESWGRRRRVPGSLSWAPCSSGDVLPPLPAPISPRQLFPHLFVSAGSAAGPGHWGLWSQLSGAMPQLGLAPGTVKSPRASALPWDEALESSRAGWGHAAPLVCGILWAARAERGPRAGGHSPARLWGARVGMEQSWCGQEAMLRGMGCAVLPAQGAGSKVLGSAGLQTGLRHPCGMCRCWAGLWVPQQGQRQILWAPLPAAASAWCWDLYWDVGTHTGVQVPVVGCTELYWDAGTCIRVLVPVPG